MKNMFEKSTYEEVVSRINQLTPDSQHLWGVMNPGQMMAHASAALRVATGKDKPKRMLIGILLAPIAKSAYVSEKPFTRNNPTAPIFVIKENRDFGQEKENLLTLIKEFHEGGHEKCTRHPHSFFGKLTTDQWASTQYKHLDHHLRQFGV